MNEFTSIGASYQRSDGVWIRQCPTLGIFAQADTYEECNKLFQDLYLHAAIHWDRIGRHLKN